MPEHQLLERCTSEWAALPLTGRGARAGGGAKVCNYTPPHGGGEKSLAGLASHSDKEGFLLNIKQDATHGSGTNCLNSSDHVRTSSTTKDAHEGGTVV